MHECPAKNVPFHPGAAVQKYNFCTPPESFRSTDNTPPFIHDLLRLAEKGGLPLSENQKDILDTITTFNLRARYDDYKMEFHRKCTKDFAEEWAEHIKEFRKWIKEKFPNRL